MEKITLALESGADDYLMKPVTLDSLREKLQILGLLN
jgi:DNA-binding response OmpR family regulator